MYIYILLKVSMVIPFLIRFRGKLDLEKYDFYLLSRVCEALSLSRAGPAGAPAPANFPSATDLSVCVREGGCWGGITRTFTQTQRTHTIHLNANTPLSTHTHTHTHLCSRKNLTSSLNPWLNPATLMINDLQDVI